MSAVVTALVRKGFVDQVPDAADQRQRVLTITAAGQKLWDELPDPIDLIQAVAFDGADQSELATALRVLQGARRGHGGAVAVTVVQLPHPGTVHSRTNEASILNHVRPRHTVRIANKAHKTGYPQGSPFRFGTCGARVT
jgi:hypothetical protein